MGKRAAPTSTPPSVKSSRAGPKLGPWSNKIWLSVKTLVRMFDGRGVFFWGGSFGHDKQF